MKKMILCLLTLSAFGAKGQSLYFPPLTGNSWDTISPASLGWCEDKIAPLYNYLGNQNTKAFILLKDGKIVMEKYFGSFTGDSLWYWASAGKTLTAFTVGIAKQEGLLSLNDTSSKYLGKGWTICPPAKENLITIRHQLTMTSGLNDGVTDPYCTLDSCLKYKADAGTRWAYHNGPYTLLDKVIETASGQTLNAYFGAKVKTATGITGLFIPSGYNNVFYSKPRSMARFGLLMLNKGNWNGNQILTDSTYFREMTTTSQQLNKSYGYLWWLNGKASYMVPGFQVVIPGYLNPNAPADLLMALGKNGQMINVVPSKKLVFIRMGDAPGAGEVPINFNDSIWALLNKIMCTTTGTQSIESIPHDAVLIYPNPAQESCTLSLPNQVFTAQISDLSGRMLIRTSFVTDQTTMNLEAIKPGIYVVQIQTRDGQTITRKLVKQ